MALKLMIVDDSNIIRSRINRKRSSNHALPGYLARCQDCVRNL